MVAEIRVKRKSIGGRFGRGNRGQWAENCLCILMTDKIVPVGNLVVSSR
jgi:hypothetical protein